MSFAEPLSTAPVATPDMGLVGPMGPMSPELCPEAAPRPARRRRVPGRPLSRAERTGCAAFGLAACLAPWHPLLAALPLAVFVALCLTAWAFPRWSFFLPVIRRGPAGRRVALTFDDGPDPLTTLPLLALLRRYGARATFFVVGEKAAAHPELIRAIVADGHEVGNHSRSHDLFLMLRPARVLAAEVADCQEILTRQGVRPEFFRPPLVLTNPRLDGVLRPLGLRCAGFSRRPADFGNRRVAGMARRVLRGLAGGAVVLLHDREPAAGPGPWLGEVERILQGVAARGLEADSLRHLVGPPTRGG